MIENIILKILSIVFKPKSAPVYNPDLILKFKKLLEKSLPKIRNYLEISTSSSKGLTI